MTLFNVRPERRDALSSGGIHNPFESPTVPLSSLALDSIYGQRTEADETVTPDSSLAIPTFFRCVNLLGTVVAGCPLKVYKNPGKTDVTSNTKVLDPNNFTTTYTPYELWKLVVTHLSMFGNAYVLKVRAGDRFGANAANPQQIVDLKPIDPSRVQPKIKKGVKVFEVHRVKPDGTLDDKAPPLEMGIDQIMHVPGLGYDGVRGLSVIEMAARTLGTAIASDKLAARFYARGTMLTGTINVKYPLAEQSDADAIRNRWLQKSAGVGHAAEVAVLDAETTFTPLTIPPDQLQFLQSRRWQTTEIARWFGIPPHLVGDVEKSTSWGTGIEQQNTGFVAYTVSDFTNLIEQRSTREIVCTNKQYCEFDMDRLLRGDMGERFAAYAIGIQWGWLNRNEVRAKENEEPVDGLDEYLTPLNMQAGSPATEMVDPAAAPLGPKATTDPKGKPATDDEESDPN